MVCNVNKLWCATSQIMVCNVDKLWSATSTNYGQQHQQITVYYHFQIFNVKINVKCDFNVVLRKRRFDLCRPGVGIIPSQTTQRSYILLLLTVGSETKSSKCIFCSSSIQWKRTNLSFELSKNQSNKVGINRNVNFEKLFIPKFSCGREEKRDERSEPVDVGHQSCIAGSHRRSFWIQSDEGGYHQPRWRRLWLSIETNRVDAVVFDLGWPERINKSVQYIVWPHNRFKTVYLRHMGCGI